LFSLVPETVLCFVKPVLCSFAYHAPWATILRFWFPKLLHSFLSVLASILAKYHYEICQILWAAVYCLIMVFNTSLGLVLYNSDPSTKRPLELLSRIFPPHASHKNPVPPASSCISTTARLERARAHTRAMSDPLKSVCINATFLTSRKVTAVTQIG
jgi:hypothetical protein